MSGDSHLTPACSHSSKPTTAAALQTKHKLLIPGTLRSIRLLQRPRPSHPCHAGPLTSALRTSTMASSSRSAGLFEQRVSRTPSPRPEPDQDPLASERVGLLTNSLPTSANGSFEDLPREARDVVDEQSREAMDAEHSLTVREAIRAYPMAIFWSLMVSMCVIMEGWSSGPCLTLSASLTIFTKGTMPS
jgi:hypothetical protein